MSEMLSSFTTQIHMFELWSWSSLHVFFSALFIVLTLPLCIWLVWGHYSETILQHDKPWREPPIYPSGIPLIGPLLLMAWDSSGLVASIVARFRNIPTRLRLLITDMYVISGPESIEAVWKEPDLHTKAYKALSVHNISKMPKETLEFWMEDDSGHHSQPHPDSKIPPHLRIDHLNYSSMTKFLTGDGLKPFAARFTTNLSDRLSANQSIGSEWSTFPDLFAFMQKELFPAAVEAMCGRLLLSTNQNFVHDFWEFNRHLPRLAKGYPRWLSSKPYKARDTCLSSLKQWHEVIRTHFDDSTTSNEKWNQNYGAPIVRYRHEMWSKMPRMNADAAATEDLGLIWAANGNSITNSFWMVAEVIRDPELLCRARYIIDSCRLGTNNRIIDLDFPKLCNDPLVQSIYAETLRLHVASFIMRGPDRKDFNLRGWRIPKDAVMLISSYNAQMDPKVWSRGDKPSVPPVKRFWAERFLEFSESTSLGTVPSSTADSLPSGESQGKVSNRSIDNSDTSKTAKFSLKGLSGAWIPYGGGQRMCPGRHFAKQEMISNLALMLALFDIELVDEAGRIPDNDMEGFGFGALWPKGKLPVRMRLRAY